MRKFWMLLLAGWAVAAGAAVADEPVLEGVERIWDAAPHNAFTDLVRWDDKFYCTFRASEAHVGGNGKIRIIVSSKGKNWKSAALLEEEGVDLRDPKLSVMPDGRLMALMGGSIYEGKELKGKQPRVAFSEDGETWTAPQRILGEGDWLWRVTWHDGTAYGVSYGRAADNESRGAKLVKSADGVTWETISGMGTDAECNEATLRFAEDGTCYALIRRDGGDKQGWIGQAAAPYTEWQWTPCGHRLGGPEFIMTPHGWWAGSRDYESSATTVLAALTPTTYEPVLVLPSGGDTSYPGMVWFDDELWMSYYSSHEEKTAIYLARFSFTGDANGAPSE
ncbi:MAG: exo-alpha-sialidase [Candidatus Hydrogenedens sp.]|nr:exo-alpha-sialidase [Candidatus Hydrogenedens sp.]